jgi:hypothetical protein
MPIDAPLTLGPFMIDGHGHIAPRLPGQRARFSFSFRARPLLARLSGSELELEAVAGRVPSTGQAATERRERSLIFGFLPRLPALLPPEWRVILAPDHRLLMLSKIALTEPPVITDLLAAITLRLLSLAPYLDVLEEAGLRSGATPGAGGTIRV